MLSYYSSVDMYNMMYVATVNYSFLYAVRNTYKTN